MRPRGVPTLGVVLSSLVPRRGWAEVNVLMLRP
jgi:hypothetical protein